MGCFARPRILLVQSVARLVRNVEWCYPSARHNMCQVLYKAELTTEHAFITLVKVSELRWK